MSDLQPSPIAIQHVRNWIFDLDNSLYPASCDLFALIHVKMRDFIVNLLDIDGDAARRLQKQYYYEHGTTLAGLMRHHRIAPDDFLDFVHDIDLSRLSVDARLNDAIAALPGRKLIFTNGDGDYARRVLDRLGLADHFEAIHDIIASDYHPKPAQIAYDRMIAHFAVDPAQSMFIEDMARNLTPAHQMGMATLWIDNGSEGGRHDLNQQAIDYRTDDLPGWLEQCLTIMAGNK